MKKILMIVMVLTMLVALYSCRSINVGGSGDIGGVYGAGGVAIPVPPKTK